MNVSEYMALCAKPCAVCDANYGPNGELVMCPWPPQQGCKILCEIGAGVGLKPDPEPAVA